jgi:hypothetical protein
MSENLIDLLLTYPAAARLAIWMMMRYPSDCTAEEIANGIPALSLSRIQQTLRWMYDGELVKRQPRVSNKPGPQPFEYRLVTPLITELRERNRRQQ